jgi:hypothetical protein
VKSVVLSEIAHPANENFFVSFVSFCSTAVLRFYGIAVRNRNETDWLGLTMVEVKVQALLFILLHILRLNLPQKVRRPNDRYAEKLPQWE